MSQMVEDGEDECAGSSRSRNSLKNTLPETLILFSCMRKSSGTKIT